MPNAFKMVTAAPSITSKVKARKKLTPVLSDPFIRKRESLQWSPLAGLWARIVLHDYCSSKEDWKIKYLTLLIFMVEVRNGYGLASQQCLPVLNSICTHILLTHVLNTTYSSSLQGRQPHYLIQLLHDAGSLVDFLSALSSPNMTTLIWPFVWLKGKLSLNHSPHIYTTMKKKEQSDPQKIPLRKGDKRKYTVVKNPQSISYLPRQKSQIPGQAIK